MWRIDLEGNSFGLFFSLAILGGMGSVRSLGYLVISRLFKHTPRGGVLYGQAL